jgi:predicted methyltransferase MtxX (methanogen marker protein 4)
MTDEQRITRLEHRVRELQTAVVTLIRHLGIEARVAAAERGRLGEIGARGETPDERLIELYSTPPYQ